jgi:hypothetical protein
MPIPVIFAALAKAGLSILGNAVLAKGKEVIENKIGIKIPDDPRDLSPEKVRELQQAQFAHEEFLVNAAIREKELEIDADKHGQTQVTDRWRSDMASDSWLSKNVRPMVLIWLTMNVTAMIIAEVFDIKFSMELFTMVQGLTGIVYGAYFLGRSLEKGASVWTKKGKSDVASR